jgi:outer membrane protein
MNQRRRVLLVALLTIATFNTGAAMAGNPPMEDPPGWIVGFGYVFAPSPFVGKGGNVSQPVPLLGYVGERLTWIGPSISYLLAGDEHRNIRTVAEMRFEGRDHDRQDPRLAALRKRRSAFEVGVDATFGYLSLAARTDISGQHSGYSFKADIGNEWPINERNLFSARAFTEWRSTKLANYYYGVAAAESAVNLPAYAPGSAFNQGIELQWSYRLHQRAMLVAGISYQRLDDAIAASPLLDSRYQKEGTVGFIYQLRR